MDEMLGLKSMGVHPPYPPRGGCPKLGTEVRAKGRYLNSREDSQNYSQLSQW